MKSSYAFSAYTLTDTSLTKGKTLVFSKILNDEEQTYDNSSGQYTVPVSGTYLFTATLCVSANTDGRLNFVADGIRFGALFVGDSKWTVCSQGTAIGRLYKGAKVWLTADTIGTAYDRVNNPLGFNYFAGYMINETRD